jgi:DNA-binding response OmpR family regulator
MKGRHLALVVEDDRPIADELAEILKSLDCESVIADNKRAALAELQSHQFCFILLDLEIKSDSDSIKGHTEHGHSLLREIRRARPEHTGFCHWLPVLIVSGFAREVPAAVDVMKDGANDIIQKPFIARDVSAKIRSALERSGRPSHDLCGDRPAPRPTELLNGIHLAIPGERVRRRTRILIGSQHIDLPNSCLKVLLHLMIARESGKRVHKRTLGASDDQGFKGISVLREALKPALQDDVNIIVNHYHGFYSLIDEVTVGSCNAKKLAEIGDAEITELARELERRLDARPKSEGNS